MKTRIKWIVMALTIALALWQVHHIADQVRESETAKVKLWANAIGQRARLLSATQHFFQQATLDEHRKMEMYTNVIQSFNDPDLSTDLQFSLAYVNYIVDSSHTPIIITTARDSLITVPQELKGMKLEGDLLEEFSQNPPFTYSLWGMPMTLYYKESQYYTQLRQVLDAFMQSFMSDITNNSIFVPVVIVDSTRSHIIAQGNIDSSLTSTPSRLRACLKDMADANDPIAITLPDEERAYVYYETTPLLRSLRWTPLFYFFIAFVLLLVSYYLFRTAHTMEQNRIWVGLAKETAHQLGTPISSLMAWTQYLRGKEFTEQYATEVDKDLHRLETITHRFSKIGSVPELKEENIMEVTQKAVDYLRVRAPKRVNITTAFPEGETFIAPLNGYLYEWVIENLCRNAIDAMEGVGNISIVASQDARKIYIDVSDTGKGMPPSVQKKIFQSGFTTKTRGWGLGLPLARRIINQYHRGRLYLKYSIPGQGTTFRIVLKKR